MSYVYRRTPQMTGERLFTEHRWRNQQAGLGVGCLWVVASLLVDGPAAWTESLAGQDTTVIEVTLRGEGVSGLTVEFARSISGRQTDYLWSGVTDASGWLELIIPGSDRALVSGFYRARALTPAGEVVGRWQSIPVNRHRRQALELRLPARPGPPVAHYPLDGDARDASGNDHHGTSSGVEPGEDRFGNESGALVFQGEQDRIDLPHQVLDGLGDVSVSLWLKTTNRGEQAIVSGANGDNDNEYILYQMREDRFRLFSHGRWGSTRYECDVDVDPIADGGWHHIVWVRNASEGSSDFYVDGAGQKGICGHLEYRALSVEDRGLVLGQEQDQLGGGFSPYQAFRGSLDDLRVYDQPLTAAEVQALHSGIKPGAVREAVPREAALSSGLEPNVPNPFNTSTWIPYRLAVPGHARLEIYNMLGQRVRILVDEFQAAGIYRPHWDARDQRGAAVAAGVYLARLVHPGVVHTRRLLYLE